MQKANGVGKRAVSSTVMLLLSILIAAFVGTFFGAPRDVAAWNRAQEQFARELGSGVYYTEAELNARMGTAPAEPPEPIGQVELLLNCLEFRPWTALISVFLALVLVKPRAVETFIAAGVSAVLLLVIGQAQAALFVGLAAVVYLAARHFTPTIR